MSERVERFKNLGKNASFHFAAEGPGATGEWHTATSEKNMALRLYMNATEEEAREMEEIAKTGFLWSLTYELRSTPLEMIPEEEP